MQKSTLIPTVLAPLMVGVAVIGLVVLSPVPHALAPAQPKKPESDKPTKGEGSERQFDKAPETTGKKTEDGSFFWGTEGAVTVADAEHITEKTAQVIKAINETLNTRYVKIRLRQSQIVMKNGAFTPWLRAMPLRRLRAPQHNLDETAKLFNKNNWSMIPMLSPEPFGRSRFTSGDIDSYVAFVDWFVTRYKTLANIKYLELINSPQMWWKATDKQLIETQNKIYERIKSKHPDVLVGTPGLEWGPAPQRGDELMELFLDKRSGAKFDFLAFHGYSGGICPPAYPRLGKYRGLAGILELRKKLNENGRQDRVLIDTEHTGLLRRTPFPGGQIPEEMARNSAVWLAQALIVKRSLTVDGKAALSGIVSLKMRPRGRRGEEEWGSLNSDGSVTAEVKAAGIVFDKLNHQVQHVTHLSGELNNPNQVWAEKFQVRGKELFVFFKPLDASAYPDGKELGFSVNLEKPPAPAVLTDILGNVAKLDRKKNFALRATNIPQFLEVTFGSGQ